MGRTPTEPTPFVPWPRAAGGSVSARALHAALVGVCAALLCVAAACSYTFDDSAAWPTVGTAVDVRGLQHVRIPVLRYVDDDGIFALLPGADGAMWMAFYPDEADEGSKVVRLVRLGDPALEETLTASHSQGFRVDRRAVYLFDYPNNDLVLHRPGAPADQRVHVPDLETTYVKSSDDGEVLGWYEQTTDPMLHVARTDGSYDLSIADAAPPGSTPPFAGGFVWVATDRLHFYSTRKATEDFDDAVPVPHSRLTWVRYLESERIFVRCDSLGLSVFPVGGSPRTLLDTSCSWLPDGTAFPRTFIDACPPGCHATVTEQCSKLCRTSSDCQEHSGRIFYYHGCDRGTRESWPSCIVASVSPDGQQRDSVAVPGFSDYLIDQCGSHEATLDITPVASPEFDPPLYSLPDPPYSFAIPARVDGRPVMKRGRSLHFSRDGTRVRFLENTANLEGTGDLMAGPVEGPYEVIAHNVLRYDELDDGRLIALVNRAYVGVHNRLVLVDERRRTMTRFVDAARDYRLIPGGREVMVWMVAVGTDDDLPADWVRVPIPN